jgi:hypothetical protein
MVLSAKLRSLKIWFAHMKLLPVDLEWIEEICGLSLKF